MPDLKVKKTNGKERGRTEICKAVEKGSGCLELELRPKQKEEGEEGDTNRTEAEQKLSRGLLERARSNRQRQLPWHFQSPNSPSLSTSHSIPFDRCRFMLAMIFVTLMLFVISFLLLLPIAWTTNSTRNATTTQTPVYCEILLLERASYGFTVHLSASVVAC